MKGPAPALASLLAACAARQVAAGGGSDTFKLYPNSTAIFPLKSTDLFSWFATFAGRDVVARPLGVVPPAGQGADALDARLSSLGDFIDWSSALDEAIPFDPLTPLDLGLPAAAEADAPAAAYLLERLFFGSVNITAYELLAKAGYKAAQGVEAGEDEEVFALGAVAVPREVCDIGAPRAAALEEGDEGSGGAADCACKPAWVSIGHPSLTIDWHMEPEEVLVTQVVGTRRWTLSPPQHDGRLIPSLEALEGIIASEEEALARQEGGRAHLKRVAASASAARALLSAYTVVTTGPGQTLRIPPGWYHSAAPASSSAAGIVVHFSCPPVAADDAALTALEAPPVSPFFEAGRLVWEADVAQLLAPVKALSDPDGEGEEEEHESEEEETEEEAGEVAVAVDGEVAATRPARRSRGKAPKLPKRRRGVPIATPIDVLAPHQALEAVAYVTGVVQPTSPLRCDSKMVADLRGELVAAAPSSLAGTIAGEDSLWLGDMLRTALRGLRALPGAYEPSAGEHPAELLAEGVRDLQHLAAACPRDASVLSTLGAAYLLEALQLSGMDEDVWEAMQSQADSLGAALGLDDEDEEGDDDAPVARALGGVRTIEPLPRLSLTYSSCWSSSSSSPASGCGAWEAGAGVKNLSWSFAPMPPGMVEALALFAEPEGSSNNATASSSTEDAITTDPEWQEALAAVHWGWQAASVLQLAVALQPGDARHAALLAHAFDTLAILYSAEAARRLEAAAAANATTATPSATYPASGARISITEFAGSLLDRAAAAAARASSMNTASGAACAFLAGLLGRGADLNGFEMRHPDALMVDRGVTKGDGVQGPERAVSARLGSYLRLPARNTTSPTTRCFPASPVANGPKGVPCPVAATRHHVHCLAGLMEGLRQAGDPAAVARVSRESHLVTQAMLTASTSSLTAAASVSADALRFWDESRAANTGGQPVDLSTRKEPAEAPLGAAARAAGAAGVSQAVSLSWRRAGLGAALATAVVEAAVDAAAAENEADEGVDGDGEATRVTTSSVVAAGEAQGVWQGHDYTASAGPLTPDDLCARPDRAAYNRSLAVDRPASPPLRFERVHDDPPITVIHNFLSSEEADHIYLLGCSRFARSTVAGDNTSYLHRSRTSSTVFFGLSETEVLRRVQQRAVTVAAHPLSHIEALQIVRYQPGQKYDAHHDYFYPNQGEMLKWGGQRAVTLFVYLTPMVKGEKAGSTYFPHLNLRVRPPKGAAVMFLDTHPNGTVDWRTFHGGEPPERSTKVGLNVWIRQYSREHNWYDVYATPEEWAAAYGPRTTTLPPAEVEEEQPASVAAEGGEVADELGASAGAYGDDVVVLSGNADSGLILEEVEVA